MFMCIFRHTFECRCIYLHYIYVFMYYVGCITLLSNHNRPVLNPPTTCDREKKDICPLPNRFLIHL